MDSGDAQADHKFTAPPMRAYVRLRPDHASAFRGSKNSLAENAALLHGFISGQPIATYSELKVEFFQPDRAENFQHLSITEPGVRAIYRRWRETLFRDRHNIRAVFSALLEEISLPPVEYISSLLSLLVEYSFVGPRQSKKDPERVIFWNSVKKCIYECPAALNVGNHKKISGSTCALSGYSVVGLHLRSLVPPHANESTFLQWKVANENRIKAGCNAVFSEALKRENCLSCKCRAAKIIPPLILVEMTKLLGQRRIRDIDDFHDAFF